jgi:hypothetical protein
MMSVASDAAASLRDRPDTYDPTRLLVVDDHAAVRAGLTQLLEDQLDFEVVAAVAGAEAALSFAERECVDAAVVDYQLGVRNGLLVSRKLKRLREPPGTDLFGTHRWRACGGRCGGGSQWLGDALRRRLDRATPLGKPVRRGSFVLISYATSLGQASTRHDGARRRRACLSAYREPACLIAHPTRNNRSCAWATTVSKMRTFTHFSASGTA